MSLNNHCKLLSGLLFLFLIWCKKGKLFFFSHLAQKWKFIAIYDLKTHLSLEIWKEWFGAKLKNPFHIWFETKFEVWLVWTCHLVRKQVVRKRKFLSVCCLVQKQEILSIFDSKAHVSNAAQHFWLIQPIFLKCG